MTRLFRFFAAPILPFGLLMALCGTARCDDPAESSRESIIQGVREDVRRHIREAGERSKRSEVSQATAARRVVKRRKLDQTAQ